MVCCYYISLEYCRWSEMVETYRSSTSILRLLLLRMLMRLSIGMPLWDVQTPLYVPFDIVVLSHVVFLLLEIAFIHHC